MAIGSKIGSLSSAQAAQSRFRAAYWSSTKLSGSI